MKIIKNQDKRAKIKIPPNSRVPIKTSDNLFTHHVNLAILGKRGSGKGIWTTNYLRMVKEEGLLHRTFVISPTIESNQALLDSLGVKKEDCYSPEDDNAIGLVMEAIDSERDDYVRDLGRIKRWKRFKKLVDSHMPVHQIDPYLLLEFCDQHGNPVEPKLKYGDRPCLHLILDDCQGSGLFSQKKFQSFIIRHRHCGMMPYDPKDKNMCGSLGISVYTMIQNLKSNHGFPRACRNNITQLAVVGHVKDKAELDDVYGSVAGEIDKEQFYEAYHYCTKEPHGVMVCDLHPKKPGQYLRKNLDEILVFDKKVNIET